MIEQEYIEPGRYVDEQKGVVTVTGRLDTNGRSEVIYSDGTRGIYSPATIRKVYTPLALAVACLALLPAFAFAAKPLSHAAGVRAAAQMFTPVAQQHWQADMGSTPLTVTCTGPTTHISCVATATAATDGTPDLEYAVTVNANGTWTVLSASFVYMRVHGRATVEPYTGCGKHKTAVCA